MSRTDRHIPVEAEALHTGIEHHDHRLGPCDIEVARAALVKMRPYYFTNHYPKCKKRIVTHVTCVHATHLNAIDHCVQDGVKVPVDGNCRAAEYASQVFKELRQARWAGLRSYTHEIRKVEFDKSIACTCDSRVPLTRCYIDLPYIERGKFYSNRGWTKTVAGVKKKKDRYGAREEARAARFGQSYSDLD